MDRSLLRTRSIFANVGSVLRMPGLVLRSAYSKVVMMMCGMDKISINVGWNPAFEACYGQIFN